jgi:hypothetical protein
MVQTRCDIAVVIVVAVIDRSLAHCKADFGVVCCVAALEAPAFQFSLPVVPVFCACGLVTAAVRCSNAMLEFRAIAIVFNLTKDHRICAFVVIGVASRCVSSPQQQAACLPDTVKHVIASQRDVHEAQRDVAKRDTCANTAPDVLCIVTLALLDEDTHIA